MRLTILAIISLFVLSCTGTQKIPLISVDCYKYTAVEGRVMSSKPVKVANRMNSCEMYFSKTKNRYYIHFSSMNEAIDVTEPLYIGSTTLDIRDHKGTRIRDLQVELSHDQVQSFSNAAISSVSFHALGDNENDTWLVTIEVDSQAGKLFEKLASCIMED